MSTHMCTRAHTCTHAHTHTHTHTHTLVLVLAPLPNTDGVVFFTEAKPDRTIQLECPLDVERPVGATLSNPTPLGKRNIHTAQRNVGDLEPILNVISDAHTMSIDTFKHTPKDIQCGKGKVQRRRHFGFSSKVAVCLEASFFYCKCTVACN